MRSEKCVSCNRKIEDIGGRKIVKCSKGGVIVFSPENKSFNLDKIENNKAYIHNLKNGKVIVFIGEYVNSLTFETIDIIEHEITLYNVIPWVCQECLGYMLCNKCNSPLVDAPMAFVVGADNEVKHVPGLGAKRPCSKCGK